jgi:hypothetical protein
MSNTSVPRPPNIAGRNRQDRDQQHLQDLALRECIDRRVGDDVEQEVLRALHLAWLGGSNALGVQRAGSMFMPAPGCTKLTIVSPTQRDAADDFE